MSTVSIIVPIYKVEQYLSRCVDSILSQTFADFELILVDDGSPDLCPQMCDQYAELDKRVKVLHLENGGVSRARNAGLDVAEGTYIAFCDSDDWWEEQLLERSISALDEADCDWLSFNFRHVDECGTVSSVQHMAGQWSFCSWKDKFDYIFTHFLQYHSGWECCVRVFKRSIIEKHQIRFCETCGNFAEDLGFCLKYLLCSDSVAAIDDCLYNYYLRDSSMMARSKSVVKLDELNEVSYDVCRFAESILPQSVYIEVKGMLHYQIMYNQYSHLFDTENSPDFPLELQKIRRTDWFRAGALATIRNGYNLYRLYGLHFAALIVNFSCFCVHRQWKLYVFLRRVINLPVRIRDELKRILGENANGSN